MQIQNEEWKSVLKRYKGRQYEIGRMAWVGDYPDPTSFLEIFHTKSTQNWTGWSNQEFDDLLATAAREPSKAKRFAILAQAETIFLDEVPVLPIYSYAVNQFHRPTLKNFHSTLQDRHPVRHVYIDDSGSSVVENQ